MVRYSSDRNKRSSNRIMAKEVMQSTERYPQCYGIRSSIFWIRSCLRSRCSRWDLFKWTLQILLIILTGRYYLIGKKLVGKKWRNFRQVTKIFTDEHFCRRIFFADENFKSVLLYNNFSCRSKVLGSLRPKSDLLRIYSVWDPTYSRK